MLQILSNQFRVLGQYITMLCVIESLQLSSGLGTNGIKLGHSEFN